MSEPRERISHYELLRRIGRGGMGEVWEATDLNLRRRVALKFLSSELTAEAEALTRFEREALAAAELSHPHIATVYAFEPDGERPFIAMQLLAGPSLRERLDAGPLSVAESLSIARDVASALAYAHRRGTSHRDIKPENLMFDEHGAIRVMDFGLARATMASRLTMTGTHLGTPAYMSPEAIRGETGPASDVFALGLVLWELLTGRRAHRGDNAMAVMFSIANESPPPVRTLRSEVPEAADELIARMLDKDPATRIDAAASARALAELTGVSVSAVAETFESSGKAKPSGGAALSSSAHTLPLRPHAPHRIGAAWIMAGLAVTVLVGVVGITWLLADAARRRDEAVRLHERSVEAARAGRSDEARSLLEEAIRKDPANANVLSSLGMDALAQGRYASAESLFQAMLRHHPKDARVVYAVHYNMGASFDGRGMYPEAVESYRACFRTDSSSSEAYNNLGWALVQNRQLTEALGVLERGIERFPGEPHLRKNAGLAWLQLGEPRRALDQLERALALDSTLTEAAELEVQARRALAARP